MNKTEEFLSSRENNGHAYSDAHLHYEWMRRIIKQGNKSYYGEPSQYHPEKIKAFFRLLCVSFNLPVPEIIINNLAFRNRAITEVLDNKVIFEGISIVYPHVVCHEFVHWYAWHVFKCVDTHNQYVWKKFERRLVWKTSKYWRHLV